MAGRALVVALKVCLQKASRQLTLISCHFWRKTRGSRRRPGCLKDCYGKLNGAKFKEQKLASCSTNLLSRSRQISIKLNKINSCSTNFLSRSRHLESSSTKKHHHFQEITIQGQEIFELSSRDHFVLLFNKNKFISISHFISYQPQIPYHVSTTWPFKVKPRMLSTT